MRDFQIVIAETQERRKAADLIASVYRLISSGAELIQKFTFVNEPSSLNNNLIIAKSHLGDVVGVMRIVERIMLVKGVRINCAGITSVAVRPDWQGRGLCSEMMKKAIILMKQRKYDLSFLHARRILDGFYTQFGFHGVGRYVDLEILNYPVLAKGKLKAVAFRIEDRVLVQRLYQKTYYSLAGAIYRTPAISDFMIQKILAKALKANFFVFLQGSQKIGYGVVVDRKLVELSIPEDHYESLVAWIQKETLQSIAIHPAHPFFLYCRREYNTLFKERFAFDGGYMARVIDDQSLVKKLGFRYKTTGNNSQKVRECLGVVGSQGSPDHSFHTSFLDEI